MLKIRKLQKAMRLLAEVSITLSGLSLIAGGLTFYLYLETNWMFGAVTAFSWVGVAASQVTTYFFLKAIIHLLNPDEREVDTPGPF